jgi:polysaccharide pyruvyl transferase WcaK-like protein
MIGGGDILRTDAELMARHYGRNSRVSYKRLRHSIGVIGWIGYELRRKLPRTDAGGFYARRFRARWMGYPAIGPFIVNARDLPPGSDVSYVSCGVPHEFAPSQCDAVKTAFEEARVVYLRDEGSAQKLRHAGVTRELHVAPDLAVMLNDVFNHADTARRGRELLSQLGITNATPVLCFQSQPYPGFSQQEILDRLNAYCDRTKSKVVLLPLGYCHGDHEFLRSLAQRANGRFHYANLNSIFDMMALIAASDVFVGTSLHGNITAFSFGIPHVFGPLPVTKTRGFLEVTNLPADLRVSSWSEVDKAIDCATSLGTDFFALRAREAKTRVYRVREQLFESMR